MTRRTNMKAALREATATGEAVPVYDDNGKLAGHLCVPKALTCDWEECVAIRAALLACGKARAAFAAANGPSSAHHAELDVSIALDDLTDLADALYAAKASGAR